MVKVKLLNNGGYDSLHTVEFPIVVPSSPMEESGVPMPMYSSYNNAVIVDGKYLGKIGVEFLFTDDEYEVING